MDDKNPPRSRPRKSHKRKSNVSWIILAFLMSFVITFTLSAGSDTVVESLPIAISLTVLFLVIILGVVFDVIGLAVATVDISPFNSMAARKLKTGQKAVKLVNNADKVSSFCNDIVGDIAGVVSGATGAGIALRLVIGLDYWYAMLITLCLTSLISSLTVGLKAIGKGIAMKHNVAIVTVVARILCGFRK